MEWCAGWTCRPWLLFTWEILCGVNRWVEFDWSTGKHNVAPHCTRNCNYSFLIRRPLCTEWLLLTLCMNMIICSGCHCFQIPLYPSLQNCIQRLLEGVAPSSAHSAATNLLGTCGLERRHHASMLLLQSLLHAGAKGTCHYEVNCMHKSHYTPQKTGVQYFTLWFIEAIT